MHVCPLSIGRLSMPALLLALLPVAVTGQVREVVSNQLAISQSEAGLYLEFADDGVLEISLRDGSVVVDDEVVGSFDRGDALDTAWRGLLGEIVNLSDGPLGQALQDWAPPSSLSGDAMDAARLLDESLEQALRPLESSVQADPEAVVDVDIATDLGLGLRALLSRSDILGELGQALEAIDVLTSAIHIGEDVVVAEDETIDGTIVVIDGELTVDGTIEDDVVIVDGSITVNDGGNVHGDIRLVDSRYFGIDESSLGGRLIRVDSDDADNVLSVDLRDLEDLEDLEDRIRDEVRSELRHEFRNQGRGFSPIRAVGRGVAEVMGDLITFLILSLLALGVVYFAKDNLVMVADTARRNPMRAGLVGVAGAFLVLPTWLLGCVALVVSVVGIIALPFWLLLFPIAVALGAGLGYLAVARNIGEWVASKDINGLEWLQPTNTFYAVATGVGAILAFSVAANVLDIVPFFGFFSGLLAALGSMLAIATLLVGFGAVLLTRGGRQAEFYDGGDPFDDGPAWEQDRFSDEVIEAEEVDEAPKAEVDSDDMADATADVADENSDEAGETGDADDD